MIQRNQEKATQYEPTPRPDPEKSIPAIDVPQHTEHRIVLPAPPQTDSPDVATSARQKIENTQVVRAAPCPQRSQKEPVELALYVDILFSDETRRPVTVMTFYHVL